MCDKTKRKLISGLSGLCIGFILPSLILCIYTFVTEKVNARDRYIIQKINNTAIKPFADSYIDMLLFLKKDPSGWGIEMYKKSYYYPYVNDANSDFDNQILDLKVVVENVEYGVGFKYILTDNDKRHLTQIFPLRDDMQNTIEEQNKQILKNYTVKVSKRMQEIQSNTEKAIDLLESINYKKRLQYKLKPELDKPNIQEELPKTQEELSDYIIWLCKVEGLLSDDELKDVYGTPVKFNIVDNGLQAISAGQDKKHNTNDDIVILNEY